MAAHYEILVPMKFSKTCYRSLASVLEKKALPDSKVKGFEDIPGPKPLPVIGNLWRYFPVIGSYSLDKIHHTYAKFYHEFGPVVKEKMFGDRVLVHVFHPEDMMTVYKNEGRWPVRQSHRALERYRKERPHIYSGPGLFPSNGEEWFRFRHLFQSTLMAPATGEACSSALENITEDLIAKIPPLLDENLEMDIQPLLFNWALECIGVVTLNRRLGCLSENGNKEAIGLINAANDIHKSVYQTENSPLRYKKSYRRLELAQDYLASVVEKYFEAALDETRKDQNKESVLTKMLQTDKVTKNDLFTMILDMFLAGIDTTAYTIAFALYNLAINKAVQDKLREELLDQLPFKTSRISESRCRLPYLQLVIKETLRVNPVAIGTGRILQSDVVLGGYRVPAKTNVILQHQVSSMLDAYFLNPRSFSPERWTTSPMPLVSSPFGYGPRMCIGVRIARKELQLSIAKLLRNFSISYHHEKIDSCNRLINVPDKPVRLRFQSLDK